MKKMSLPAFAATWILCFIFWMLITGQIASIFTGQVSLDVIIAGVLVCLVVAVFSSRFFIHDKAFFMLEPSRLVSFLAYCLGVFPVELVKANVDVALKALSPGLKNKIKPGIVKIPVGLTSEYGQAMLANSITLTPGTITMDAATDESDGQLYYYIHWLNVESEDPAEAGEAIKGRMERALRRVWE